MIRQPPPAKVSVDKVHRLQTILESAGLVDKRTSLLALHLSELDDEAAVFSKMMRGLFDSKELSIEELLDTLVEIETALLHLTTHTRAAKKEVTHAANALDKVIE